MYIKQITISGFKSYRDATIAGPFSPGHNVVVGRNGSGKSNFFDAVRFVLSDTFSSLRAEERVALLHEGAGASVLSAYVEMLFDNSDGRLPSDRDVVALRRMVGLKKDEYVLDRKNVTRTEVFNLLESAGFSRSNPYYIVQQGKVAALCGMTDRQRLDLLKEVAGTRVYDERREESLKIMDETDQRREKITEVVNFIESRLAELESEKEELKAFQKYDKERKALQYTIHILELEEAKATLDSLDGAHTEQRSRGEQLNSRLMELRVELGAAENEAKNIAPQIRTVQDERNSCDTQRKAAIEKIAKLQVNVAEATQAADQTREMVASTRTEMAEIQQQIRERNYALEPLDVQFQQVKQNESAVTQRMKQIDRELLALRVKANRLNQFADSQQRDNHLRRNIREARKRLTTFNAQITSATREVDRLQLSVERNEEKLSTKRQEAETLKHNMGDFSDLDALRAQRDDMHTQRKDLWRKNSEVQARVRELQSRVHKMEGRKRSVLGGGAYEAIRAVMRFSEQDPHQFGPDRVFGPLVDLIDVDPKFASAADVTAGSTLTHVVVDTDGTAARLVTLMQQRRAGRVTFIPLNRLERNLPPPPTASREAIPLVSKIKCDPRFNAAVQQVFSRTLVTRTVAIATELSHDHGVDCVTLDGDQVNKRGAMTGGFLDIGRSRILAASVLREARKELDETTPQIDQLKQQEEEMHAQMSHVLGEVQRREGTQRSANSTLARINEEISQLERYIATDKTNIPRAHERVAEGQQSIAVTNKSIEDMEQEMGTPMSSGLTPEEEAQMDSLKQQGEDLRGQLASLVPHRTALEKQVVSLRADLKNNLEKREARLKRQIAEAGVEGDDGTVDGEEVERRALLALQRQTQLLEKAEHDLEVIKHELKQKDAELTAKKREYGRLNALVEQQRDEESNILKTLDDDQQLVEKQYNLRAVQTQRKNDAEKHIRELGSLPADFDKYRGQSIGALMKKLKRTNENLNKYSHVNKKALEQFVNFTEQRDALAKRREELDSGAEAIRSLIESLDLRKDEDIMRTFKGVSKYFSEVFSELVPGGRASLVMLKSSSSNNNDDGENNAGGGNRRTPGRRRGGGSTGRKSGSRQQEAINGDEIEVEADDSTVMRIEYSGVAMKVAFSRTGEAYLLQQLSGGQKSIVALALIFAIQRLDPAPFYLFDEIDANLDATHRQAVANIIRKQASHGGTQFITTTFRPELVNAGDMWYGVTHKKKVSSVQEVDRDVALTFITDEPAPTTRRRR